FKSNNQSLIESDDQNLDESNNQNLAKMVDTPTVGQIFGSWEELDRYISLYARSQNFVNVIRGSDKRTGCRWQIRASCPKTTGILIKYRAFSEDMLKDIKFWTEIDLSNAIQTYKRQNRVEYEAATLFNHLLVRKAEDTR
ncbi:12519_t:CDS:2, partial [Gigaspora rosea]